LQPEQSRLHGGQFAAHTSEEQLSSAQSARPTTDRETANGLFDERRFASIGGITRMVNALA
jgi:hypothetical protein